MSSTGTYNMRKINIHLHKLNNFNYPIIDNDFDYYIDGNTIKYQSRRQFYHLQDKCRQLYPFQILFYIMIIS